MARKSVSRPPKAFKDFSKRFPRIAEAWALLGEAGASGPLDEKTARLVKLGISIASRSQGATHSATRKALAVGATTDEIHQVVALAASSIGLPNTVAAFTWVQDELG
ncbi:MAG: carboxymuconolactone decarboxylase family protein [Planctomycetes bacterium]|nr:carboxymuconolactone decarboxylase family protein [Planctomycetota bacterium]